MLVLTQSFNPFGVASKPTRNGYVHPMIHLQSILIAASLTCSEATDLIDKMKSYRVEEEVRSEMIQIVKEETKGCNWDAKAD